MREQFIPYEQALELKDLGFECESHFMEYDNEGFLQQKGLLSSHNLEFIVAPLYQQVFDWLREKYGLIHGVDTMYTSKGKEWDCYIGKIGAECSIWNKSIKRDVSRSKTILFKAINKNS